MYSNDDQETAKLGDRIISAAFAGVCGFLFGWVVALVVVRIFQSGDWVVWVPAIILGAFGFMAPTRSRDMLTDFWNQLLNYFLRGR